MDKKYNIIAFDAQYILVRNFMGLKRRNKRPVIRVSPDSQSSCTIDEYYFQGQDLVRQFFWSIGKLIRDYYPCNKIILLWDKAPYYKNTILGDFKNSRVYHTEEALVNIDANKDPEKYFQEVENIRIEKVKQSAKYWIMSNLTKLGLSSVSHDGFEADDLAYIFANYVFNNSNCAICSADSDWEAWSSSSVDFINFNNKKSYTYDEICKDRWESYPDLLKMSLFEVKSYADSLFMSHNDLVPTSDATWTTLPKVIDHIKNNNYIDIYDKERFDKNMETFKIDQYPGFQDVITKLTAAVDHEIEPSMDSYYELKRAGFLVSESYIKKFIDILLE